MDKIKTERSLGSAIRTLRKREGLTAVAVAKKSGRSRDILHRLESGRDISMSALLDILRATGYAIQLVPAGIPSLEEVRKMFADEVDDD